MFYSVRQWAVAHGYKSIWHEIRASVILVTLIWIVASSVVTLTSGITGVDGFITPFGIALDGIQASVHWYESYMTVTPIRESVGAWYGLELPSEWGL